MFRIHADQVQAFAEERRRAFERGARETLASRLGAAPDEAFVTASVDRALSRGISGELHVLQYLALEAHVNGDLLSAWPWTAEVLADDRRVPVGKLRIILRQAAARGVAIDALDLVQARAS